MMQMDSFADVLRAVAQHAVDSGHVDIRACDDPPALLTGYCCHDCEDYPTAAHWMAHADTIHNLPKVLRWRAMDTTSRIRLVNEVIKKAIEPRPYCPTAWQRVLKVR